MPTKAVHLNSSNSREYELLSNSGSGTTKENKFRKDACFLTLFGAVGISVLLGFFLWYLTPGFTQSDNVSTSNVANMSTSNNSLGWINTYRGLGAEGSIRLVNIDEDGILDIIYSIGQPTTRNHVFNQPAYCKNYESGCLGAIIGMRGSDGVEIWNLPTKQEVFELNCHTIDINRDGKLDCLAAGRKATILAFDPRTGQHLWSPQGGNEPYLDNDWNIYNPLTLSDLDGDGVGEVFLAHGGDPLFPPDNHTRFPARFVVLSGASGVMLNNYFQSPDGKETYNSPVLHTSLNGDQHILFGTGGETVRGSLYAVRMDRLLCLTKGLNKCGDVGTRELYNSDSKGIMVPVVLADMNNDGENDIIMITFDGTIAVFDGSTFNLIWKRELSGYESYSTPAIGYFNADGYLDVMTVWNLGQWPDYSLCMTVVMDGKTGNAVWSFNTSRFSMVSPLVVRSVEPLRDAFLLGVQGRSGLPLEDSIGVIHGIDPQRQLIKPKDGRRQLRSSGIDCNSPSLEILAAEILLVDSSSLGSPIRLWRRDVDKFYYDASAVTDDSSKDFKSSASAVIVCAVMEQASRNTGAIGDVDGDGYLDLVMPFSSSAIIMKDGQYLREEISLDIVKVSFERHIERFPTISINSTVGFIPRNLTHLSHTAFLPVSKQPWTAYMGAFGDSIFKSLN